MLVITIQEFHDLSKPSWRSSKGQLSLMLETALLAQGYDNSCLSITDDYTTTVSIDNFNRDLDIVVVFKATWDEYTPPHAIVVQPCIPGKRIRVNETAMNILAIIFPYELIQNLANLNEEKPLSFVKFVTQLDQTPGLRAMAYLVGGNDVGD